MNLKPGDRIELIRMVEEVHPVKPGTQGRVTKVCELIGWWQIWVDWDNGRKLAMILPGDEYRLLSTTLKLFTDPKPSSIIEDAKLAIEAEEHP